MSLHVARKGILDHDGIVLAYMLRTNKVLRKLELEGNNLGPLCAFAFGRVLQENKSLRFLDLESNQLTNDGSDFKGVLEMLNFLDHNDTLMSLNIANNSLNEDCGAKLREKLECNYSIIDSDCYITMSEIRSHLNFIHYFFVEFGIFFHNHLQLIIDTFKL